MNRLQGVGRRLSFLLVLYYPTIVTIRVGHRFINNELTTRAFGTAFVMGCAQYSLRTSGPWPPARRGLRPQTPARALYSIFHPTA
jgi:hypothetical protein